MEGRVTGRYGKSSLVLYSLAEAGILHERVNIFVAVDENTVKDLILSGVQRLINRISKTPEQIIRFMRDYFKKLKTTWTINTDDVTSSAVVKALRVLEKADYIQKNPKGQYFIIDPLIKDSLLWFYSKN